MPSARRERKQTEAHEKQQARATTLVFLCRVLFEISAPRNCYTFLLLCKSFALFFSSRQASNFLSETLDTLPPGGNVSFFNQA